MVTVLITHEVSDFNVWKMKFDQYEPIRTMAGFSLVNIYSDINDSNKLTIIFRAPSIEAVHAVFSDPKLREDMTNAGVVKKPEIQILHRI